MMKGYSFRTNPVWKGSLILISYFFFTACMQHDESLAPRALQNQDLIEVNSDAQGMGSMMKRTFTAHLQSRHEIPTLREETQAQGQAIFTLSKDGTTIHYKLIVANIDKVFVAHIHCGAEDERGSPLVTLYGPPHPISSDNGVLIEGDITAADFTALPDEPGVCAGGSPNFENLIERFQNGTTYVNVHTTANRGGEIRGQIQ